jgi:HAD superfamily hydrolase (TIGR01509 family)
MNYKAIIFDMDGTIISTEMIWQIATQNVLDIYVPHLEQAKKDEIKTHLIGLALYESCKYIKQFTLNNVSADEIREEKARQAHKIYNSQGLSFIPFFQEFHNKISKLGLKNAIATNATNETVIQTLTMLPLRDFFAEHIYHIDMVERVCKPNPAIYLYAAKQINIDPKDCIAIEDSAHGIKAAKAAGMYCIAINSGKNRALLHEADEIVECYTEIDLDKLLHTKK